MFAKPNWCVALFCGFGVLAAAGISGAEPAVDFTRDIKPILSNHCYRCHGPDADERKGGTDGLRLDVAEGALADLGSGKAAIAPGRPEQSMLIERVKASDADEAMPPVGAGRRLTPREIELLETWIRQGANYSRHWSYVKPVRPPLPAVGDRDWCRNDVDYFILSRLEREGLKPVAEADRYALIRRLSLDLTGLPPTLAEADAFVNDPDPKAYENLVDRVLAKEAYGEYWAHLWLDLARYADSAGYADDPARTIWLYRDYVIQSLNQNKPFDQFTIEQIAGDLLPNPSEEQLTATAFHRNTLTNNEGGTNDEEFRNVAIVDRVNTTMAVWMGTTISCAQCHNHKYDPISQVDFYRLFAIFNNTADADRRDESPLLSVHTEEQKRQRSAWEEEVRRLEVTLRTVTPELAAAQAKWEAAFPRGIAWRTPKPATVKTRSSVEVTIQDDARIAISKPAEQDTYTLEIPLEAGMLSAVRLETVPAASLPGGGAGHGGGNFVVTRVTAGIAPPEQQPLSGRFVRVEIPGKQKILSLAELQVFRGNENLALKGTASQSTTDYEGDAKRAIDGNTDGRYVEAKSTSHTAISDDPWWEVDLQAMMPIDRIAIWNRTDATTVERLANFQVSLLDENRNLVWRETVAQPPKPSLELSLSGLRAIEFRAAVADYSQDGFAAGQVLANPDPKQKGWAVGGQHERSHALTLLAKTPLETPAGATLQVTIEQASQHAKHVLGSFRIALTSDVGAEEFGRTPQAVVATIGTPAEQRTAAQQEELRNYFLGIAPELAPVRERLAAVRKQLADLQPVTVPIMKELAGNERRVTKVQIRGNFLELGEEVREGLPSYFNTLEPDARPDRLALARWLIDEENPLTARVVANRYWEQLFGVGIVTTSEEFGSQGDLPTHPELLDYLATELHRVKWDLKAFVKLLVTSAAYRQSSRVTPELAQRDPDNRLLARGPRFRLAAETVRDQALAVAGLLSSKMYGPPVKPPQPSLGLSAAFGSGIDWQTSPGEDRYRRALYTTWRRSNPYPSMATFDAPNREVCTVRRARTNTPLQALVTLNDPVYLEAAQGLARRVVVEGGDRSEERLNYAFRLCLTRPPKPDESARLQELYTQALTRFRESPDDARRIATEPLGPVPAEQDQAELAALTLVGNVLLNLDETLMKR